ncbi:hypothetical protein ZWY2020_033523 [Hordeum vulgare]|nr:hypothetical protein ZWY2020_033523 [Hordeum vulgare]
MAFSCSSEASSSGHARRWQVSLDGSSSAHSYSEVVDSPRSPVPTARKQAATPPRADPPAPLRLVCAGCRPRLAWGHVRRCTRWSAQEPRPRSTRRGSSSLDAGTDVAVPGVPLRLHRLPRSPSPRRRRPASAGLAPRARSIGRCPLPQLPGSPRVWNA